MPVDRNGLADIPSDFSLTSSRRRFFQSVAATCAGCFIASRPGISAQDRPVGELQALPPACANFLTGQIKPPDAFAKFKGMAALDKVWKESSIRVRFINGHDTDWGKNLHEKVRAIAPRWSQFANVKFEFVDDDSADIRVNFTRGGETFSSEIGTDARGVNPSMSLVFLQEKAAQYAADGNKLYHYYILHEFGHALGFYHEHQRPNFIIWNEEKLRAYAQQQWPTWQDADIKQWILRTEAIRDTLGTAFDIESVMMYDYPPGLASYRQSDGTPGAPFSSVRHADLSLWDKIAAAVAYPGDSARSGVKVLIADHCPIDAEINRDIRVSRFRLRISAAGDYRVTMTGKIPAVASLLRHVDPREGGGIEILSAMEKKEDQPAELKFTVKDPPSNDWDFEVRHSQLKDGVGPFNIAFNKV